MSNLESLQYYRITETSYKALDTQTTPFMNLGLWPASDIRSAQEKLVDVVVTHLAREVNSHLQAPRILELGPGWGGSRAVIQRHIHNATYVGLNSSEAQIQYAAELNGGIPNTTYLKGFFEDIGRSAIGAFDAALAIESVIHVNDKTAVINKCADVGIDTLVMAEICPEDRAEIDSNPLFNPSLKYTWPVEKYREELRKTPFTNVEFLDYTDQVFKPWSDALNSIDENAFNGNSRVLRQFKKSYADLADMSAQGRVKYIIIIAKREN